MSGTIGPLRRSQVPAMPPAALLSPGRISEAALLQRAAQVLVSEWPALKVDFTFDFVPYLARFDWPGIVRVHALFDGKLVAISKPGRPHEPDTLPGTEA